MSNTWVPFETILCENNTHYKKYLYLCRGAYYPGAEEEELLFDISRWARSDFTVTGYPLIMVLHGETEYMRNNFHIWDPLAGCSPLTGE